MKAVSAALAGKSVFLTGHTGFTGSWLSSWLAGIGCEVYGYALPPETEPNHFSVIDLKEQLAAHEIGDIGDYDRVKAALGRSGASLVMHLAAQPLVLRSYADPLATFSTNVMGTANVLEAARNTASVEAFVCVTTDKVYENAGGAAPFREGDRLGGNDPYSSSKASAELVARCYRETMSELGYGMRVATARGGNIIGGGDWSEDRIVPDFFRALASGAGLRIRNPYAVRPWQHVLAACHGYIAIAARLLAGDAGGAWNIGPSSDERIAVGELVARLGRGGSPAIEFESSPLKEARFLALDASKAGRELGFASPWSADETVERTAAWYHAYYSDRRSAAELTTRQLRDYRTAIGDL